LKTYLKVALLGTILFLGGCNGCKLGEKYQKPDVEPSVTNQFSNGFNQEHYIWETWNVPKPKK